MIPQDVQWLYQQIFQDDEKLVSQFIQSWSQQKHELFAQQCGAIINRMPEGDQEILGYLLTNKDSGFDWFFEEYFRSSATLQPYIAEFEQYRSVSQSALQAST